MDTGSCVTALCRSYWCYLRVSLPLSHLGDINDEVSLKYLRTTLLQLPKRGTMTS